MKPLIFDSVFQDLYRLRDSGEAEVEEYEAAMQEFSRILYGDEPPTEREVAEGVKAATEFVRSAGRMQRSLYNPLILMLSDVFDGHP